MTVRTGLDIAVSRPSPPSGIPDEELMRALYREHAGPLLAYVLRLVAGDRQRAEDVVQETLIRAWKNAGRLNRATGSVRPWLVTVARRIVIDNHRSRQARPREVDPSPLEVIPAEDEIDKALWLMTLSDALEDLTPRTGKHWSRPTSRGVRSMRPPKYSVSPAGPCGPGCSTHCVR